MTKLLESSLNHYADLLKSTLVDKIPQGDRTLLEHLLGTMHLLKEWENPDHLCIAGLFHSIYGTCFFKESTFSLKQRKHLRSWLGHEAEQIVFNFSICSRTLLLNRPHIQNGSSLMYKIAEDNTVVDSDMYSMLVELSLANFLEHYLFGSLSEDRKARLVRKNFGASVNPRESWYRLRDYLSPISLSHLNHTLEQEGYAL